MSSDRDAIFSSIRKALEPIKNPAPMPEWDTELVISRPSGEFASLKDQFENKLKFASARFMDSVDALGEFLKAEGVTIGYCDPALAGRFAGLEGVEIETEYDEAKIDVYGFGITRATAGIAESGTIMLRDQDTSARLAALAPWIHVAVIDEKDIVATIPDAIERFGDDPSIIFCTGPSKTADVEGILIEGVHGPGIQVALVI
ncbi:MAG: LutC/YkgG family protein [Verrucomicrobiales bacterium]|nr:LUD domain-containing protein [Verrucomicrobiota bacterium JB025]